MEKINVDIKNGEFITYPEKKVLPFLKGYLNKAYYRTVGNSLQLKVVLIDKNIEYTLNCITGNVTYQSLVTTLIENLDDEINLILDKKSNSERDYYLVINKKDE
jgi:hypothetical protein